MGEDESLPGKRLALICQNCRLVNGQAPPSARQLSDVGKWKCYSCGSMNGEEDEVKQIVKSLREGDERKMSNRERATGLELKQETEGGGESDVTQYSEDGDDHKPKVENVSPTEEELPKRRSKRVRQQKDDESE